MKSIIRHIPRGGAKTASYVLMGFFLSPLIASAVDMPDGYTQLDWIESYNKSQWIDTGYVPNANTVVSAKLRPTDSGGWTALFGVFSENDNTSYGIGFRQSGAVSGTLNAFFCSNHSGNDIVYSPGTDYEVELKSGSYTLSSADGTNTKTFTTTPANFSHFSAEKGTTMLVFCEHNYYNNAPEVRRHSNMRLYSMSILETDGGAQTPVRNFIPCRDGNGACGLWDSVEGKFYANKGSNGDFRGSGIVYSLVDGVATVAEGGVLSKAEANTISKFLLGASCTDNKIVFRASEWTPEEFVDTITGTKFAEWTGAVSYTGSVGDEKGSASAGQIRLAGEGANLVVDGDIALSSKNIYVTGNVAISGEDNELSVTDVRFSNIVKGDSILSVRDGAKLLASGDVVLGTANGNDNNWYRNFLIVDDAGLSLNPLPSGSANKRIRLGAANSANGILVVKDGGVVNDRITGGDASWGRSAVIIEAGGVVTNHCGAGGDGYISKYGYGYLENGGEYVVKGWHQVAGNDVNNSGIIGLIYQKGDLVFNPSNSGQFEICRGATGVVYQTSGTTDIKSNNLEINSQGYSRSNSFGVLTIEGSESIAKATKVAAANAPNVTGVLNLREGGTLQYDVLVARDTNQSSIDTELFYVNFDGGYLRHVKSGSTSGNLFDTTEAKRPTAVTIFGGGMGVDVPDGYTTTLNMAVSAPTGRGVASIALSSEVLDQEYIGAPFVSITGDGWGATAVAVYDSATRRVTGVKVTSPGCGYTTASAVLAGGRVNSNAALPAAVTLTPDGEGQLSGGLLKRGAGTLVLGDGTLPDNLPLTLEGGVLDLGGVTYHTPVLTLAGGKVTNGSVVANKIVSSTGGAEFLQRDGLITLVPGGSLSVASGTLTVDTRGAGLMMTLVSCFDLAGVNAVMDGTTAIDWTGATRVFDFNRANSTAGWSNYQVLAYRGYIWNRGESDAACTFGEVFDDGASVFIDGKAVMTFPGNQDSWNHLDLATVTLTPGAHAFEVRFAQLAGGAGPANQTSGHNDTWPPSTLAFGIDWQGRGTYDISDYDRLTDLWSGERFTISSTQTLFDGTATVAPGAMLSFNGGGQELTLSQELAISAADILAGRCIAFEGASVSFAAGATLAITGLDAGDLDITRRYVLLEAEGGIEGLENLTISPAAPKGWRYELRGSKLTLAPHIGLAVIVR